jgi:hypothetical protein
VGKRARSAADPMMVDLREALKDLARSLFDPYRPELHYMRGPGPKWHAKHDRAPLDSYDALTAFVPLRSDATLHSCHCAVIGDGGGRSVSHLASRPSPSYSTRTRHLMENRSFNR